jgi:hypothetical protein
LRKLEIIENNYFENHKNEEKEIFEETKITDVDIKKELHKREKVQKLKKL